MGRLVKAAGALTLLGLIAAGCGGDDSGSAGDTTTTASEDTTTTANGDDGGSGVDMGTDLGAILDDDCKFLVTGAYLNPLAGLTSGKGDDIEKAADYFAEVADNAPDEIKDAMATVADGIAEVGKALEGVDISNPASFQDPEVLAKLQDLQDVFDDEYQQASEEVSDWIDENCR